MSGSHMNLDAQLKPLLERMNDCARELERLTMAEYEAIRSLDGERVLSLADERLACHRRLNEMEQECRQLLTRIGIDASMSLEAVIDLYAGESAEALQSLRRNLYERILQVDRRGEENRLRMHAAYNVSAAILQHLGLAHHEQTYRPRAGG